jgi:lipopolysaccharide export system permease protein
LTPGQFRALGSGVTLSFRGIETDGTLRQVFLQRDLPAAGSAVPRMQIVLADHAHYAVTRDNEYYRIELLDGESYEGAPGTGQWRITRFAQQIIRVPMPGATLPGRPRVDGLTVAQLRASSDPRFFAELHWRLSWVLITMVLGVLAVPLAHLRPRQGRHARVVWAVLLFAVYAGLLSAGRTMLERGEVPRYLGLWWAHVVAILLGLALLRLPRIAAWLARKRVR